jgi:threonine aldolase
LGITGTIQTNQIVSRYYNGSSGTGGIFQTVVPNTTIANALVKWEHTTSGNFPLPMMTLSGTGNLSVNGSSVVAGNETVAGDSKVFGNAINEGFTQMGFTAPLIKTTLTNFVTTTSSLISSIPHGLAASKIVSYQVIINSGIGYVTANNLDAGLQFGTSFDSSFIIISRSSTNGGTLAGKQGTIFITYTN